MNSSPPARWEFIARPLVAMSIIIVLAGFLGDWLVRKGRDERLVGRLSSFGLAIWLPIVQAGIVATR